MVFVCHWILLMLSKYWLNFSHQRQLVSIYYHTITKKKREKCYKNVIIYIYIYKYIYTLFVIKYYCYKKKENVIVFKFIWKNLINNN